MLALLLLLAAFDGEAALKHAKLLAALGPHPWGSPRGRAAAEYVRAQFREAGLDEVRLQEFEAEGVHGQNVIGVLRASGPDFVVVAAHHDTTPEAPGAYDDGGGVGILIETARVMAREKTRPRTLVFVSFDGEESESVKDGVLPTGSAYYVKSMLPERDHLVAAFVIEMSGFPGGSPVLHPIAYADPLRPGHTTITPAWLARAALGGAQAGGQPLGVGDPLIAWLYQPVVRSLHANFYGDDISFLRQGLPAVFVSDSSLAHFYPWYHTSGDTGDRIDAASLARMGQAALGVVHALERVTREDAEPAWFAGFGTVVAGPTLWLIGFASLVPGLFLAYRERGRSLVTRGLEAILFGVLLVRHPVPALWTFLAPHLGFGPRWVRAATLLPLASLLLVSGLAWKRGMLSGSWLAGWELALAAAALALLFVPTGARPSPHRSQSRRRAPAARPRTRAA